MKYYKVLSMMVKNKAGEEERSAVILKTIAMGSSSEKVAFEQKVKERKNKVAASVGKAF